MVIFALGIEPPFGVTVQRLHHADASEHRWPVLFDHYQQRFDSGLPFIALLREHLTVAELPAAQDYRRMKFAGQHVYAFGTGAAARAA